MQQSLQQTSFPTVPLVRSRVAEVAAHQFSRKFFGADPREVSEFLAETAESLKDLANALELTVVERTALETRLKDVTGEVETLRREVTVAQQKTAAYQEQESLIARTLLNAQKAAEDLIQTARAKAEAIVSEADTVADGIVQAASRTAAETLREAQTRAEEIVEAAEQTAAARLAHLQAESDWLVAQAHRIFAEVQRSVEQNVAFLISGIETFIADWRIGLRHEVRNEILPALRQGLAEITQRSDGARRSLSSDELSPQLLESQRRSKSGSPCGQEQDTPLNPLAATDAMTGGAIRNHAGGMRHALVSDRQAEAVSTGPGVAGSSGTMTAPCSRLTQGESRRGSGLSGVIFWAITGGGVLSILCLKRRPGRGYSRMKRSRGAPVAQASGR